MCLFHYCFIYVLFRGVPIEAGVCRSRRFGEGHIFVKAFSNQLPCRL